MIRSMTGFGAGRGEGAGVVVSAEVKSTNGRFLKLAMRLPPALSAREQELDALVRSRLRRGSATLKVELREDRPDAVVKIDEDVVRAYQAVFRRLGIPEAPLATLPGVLSGRPSELSEETWQLVTATVERTTANASSGRSSRTPTRTPGSVASGSSETPRRRKTAW